MIEIDGEKWIIRNRIKTDTTENVPLLPILLDIIQKYRNHDYCKAFNKLLPMNSNQRYNAYLKEIAHVCGIKKKLTTHTARHTFATTVLLINDATDGNSDGVARPYRHPHHTDLRKDCAEEGSKVMQKLKEEL